LKKRAPILEQSTAKKKREKEKKQKGISGAEAEGKPKGKADGKRFAIVERVYKRPSTARGGAPSAVVKA